METGLRVTRRLIPAAMLAVLAVPAAAAREGGIAEESRGTIAITASVAGQARLSARGDALCLWSNTATRLLDIAAAAADATRYRSFVAEPTADCTADGAARSRLVLTSAARASPGGAVAILVSPE